MNEKRLFYDLNYQNFEEFISQLGEPAFRTQQLWHGIYRNHWDHPSKFSNIPKNLRDQLANIYSFSHLRVLRTQTSSDGETIKTLFSLPDKNAVEAVLMKYIRRRTLCISTQAGCAMGCVFCATGQMGFRRNLTSGEIVEQVLFYSRALDTQGEKVTNIVIMGMGEPFHNYTDTMKAVEQLNDPRGFNLGQRKMTISTVGIIPGIMRFADENRQVNLAVSLHAATDKLRSSMLPINNKYPLSELISACKYYVSQTNRRITFEWALIDNVNDSIEQAQMLSNLVRGLLCHVNIIPLNPTNGYEGKATTEKRAQAFKNTLTAAGIPCTIRTRRGIDIQAGCGQLATQIVQQSESYE